MFVNQEGKPIKKIMKWQVENQAVAQEKGDFLFSGANLLANPGTF